MRAGQELPKEEMPAGLEAKIDDNHVINKKFLVLRNALVSGMDIHQAWTEAMQEKMLAKMETHHERKMARMDSQ
jgi:hypothetical protein